jgi:hypothetical protein
MRGQHPNSICKKCWNLSSSFSNDSCGKRLADGSICKGVLFSINESELIECSECAGAGDSKSARCVVCQGYGLEFKR